MDSSDQQSEYDVKEYQRIKQVIADPAGVPLHHTKIDAEKRHETPTSTAQLSEEFKWFYLGFAYCLIKVDRSLLEIFQSAASKTIPIRTHKAPNPIVRVQGADFGKNPWAYIIQGIPRPLAQQFADFIASYQFNRPDTGEHWCCDFKEVRIADPFFTTYRRGVDIMVALPANLTKKRRFRLVSEPSLLLEPPVFGAANG
jgi:hypothetical protein